MSDQIKEIRKSFESFKNNINDWSMPDVEDIETLLQEVERLEKENEELREYWQNAKQACLNVENKNADLKNLCRELANRIEDVPCVCHKYSETEFCERCELIEKANKYLSEEK